MGAPPNKAAAIRGRTREGRAGGGKKGGWGTNNKVAATGGEEKPEWHADRVPGPLALEG